jgi:hypothetical protein
MAVHASHAALPYPIRGARFSLLVPFLDADGDPTDPTTPDSEVSKDNGAFADCAEEVSVASGGRGMGLLTLSGAEMDAATVGLWIGAASGPKATLVTLYPRVLPVLESGTAQAGAAGSLTLAADASGADLRGCLVKTTGGTGGGGTGGANNQARRITAYNPTTKVATVSPPWETTPDGTTTYEILVPDGVALASELALLSSGSVGLAVIQSLAALVEGRLTATRALLLENLVLQDAATSSRATPAQVNAEVVDALTVDLRGEPPQGAPPVSASVAMKQDYLYKWARNRVTQSASEQKFYADDGTTVDHKAAVSDDGATFTRDTIGSGP